MSRSKTHHSQLLPSKYHWFVEMDNDDYLDLFIQSHRYLTKLCRLLQGFQLSGDQLYEPSDEMLCVVDRSCLLSINHVKNWLQNSCDFYFFLFAVAPLEMVQDSKQERQHIKKQLKLRKYVICIHRTCNNFCKMVIFV